MAPVSHDSMPQQGYGADAMHKETARKGESRVRLRQLTPNGGLRPQPGGLKCAGAAVQVFTDDRVHMLFRFFIRHTFTPDGWSEG